METAKGGVLTLDDGLVSNYNDPIKVENEGHEELMDAFMKLTVESHTASRGNGANKRRNMGAKQQFWQFETL